MSVSIAEEADMSEFRRELRTRRGSKFARAGKKSLWIQRRGFGWLVGLSSAAVGWFQRFKKYLGWYGL